MLCKKCRKEILDDSVFCNFCGRKQVNAPQKTHRRARGTGTITVDKRYKNKFIARTPRYYSGQGFQSGYHFIGAFSTRAEAQTALDAYFDSTHPNYSKYTLAQIYDKWSETHFDGLSESAVANYKASYTKYLKDIQPRKMSELKTADFQQCINLCKKNNGRAKCSKVKQLCSQLCKFAMQNDVIDKNYAEYVKLPEEVKTEKEVFTADEIATLWEHSSDERVKIILFMIYTGLRIGEVVTIKKCNVHLNEEYLTGGIKTDAGKDRVVPIVMPELKEFVQHWLDSSDTEFLLNYKTSELREKYFYPALCELKMIDKPKLKEYINKKTKKVTKREYVYENPRLTPHCTRHTFVTLSEKAGIKPEELQRIVGHASYSTTVDVYDHKETADLITAMKKLTSPSKENVREQE